LAPNKSEGDSKCQLVCFGGYKWRILIPWLNPDADGLAQMFKDHGVSAYSLHRNSDDPNALMCHLRFADEITLKSFEAWYEVSKAEWESEHPGSKHDIVPWIGKDVPGYSRTL
jgi:hypothetical protein